MAIERKLPSGAKLEITVADFATSKKLYMVVAEEALRLRVSSSAEMEAVIKDLLCLAVSSEKIEAAIWACMSRCTYNGVKVTQDTFEPVEAREDYLAALFEVASENIRPFTKSLYARFREELQKLTSSLA